MKPREDDLIVGIDIGSSKIVVAVSEIDDNGNINIIGVGKSDSKGGIKNGVIVNIETVVASLIAATEQAEIQAGREIKKATIGFAANNIETINSKGIVAISGNDKEIRDVDIDRVIDAAKAVAIPMDREILHIVPQRFTVDNQKGIRYPIGMVGTRLECQIHILTSPISSIQNVIKSMSRAGLEIRDIVLQNIASSRAILAEDEKELGVLMLDIGSETVKASIYCNQAPYYNTIYSFGGYLITNDLAHGLKIPFSTAEKLKIAFGIAYEGYVEENETIQIPNVGGRMPRVLARANLIHIIKPRVEEFFNIIKEDIKEKGFIDKISGGIVLTGGTSLLPGIVEVCQDVFDVQTRVGHSPKFMGLGDQILTPEYSVASGLILWGYERNNKTTDLSTKNRKDESKKNIMDVIKDLINKLF